MNWIGIWLATAICAVASIGCGSDPAPGTPTDQAIRALIGQQGLTGDPAIGRELPRIEDPIAVLGRKLFFSKTLSGDLDVACVSCHHPMLGGGDALPLSIGVAADEPDMLGPGRTHPDGDFTVPRNAPSTFNLGLWDVGLFWDSRVQALEEGGIRTPDSDPGTADPDAGQSISEAQARFPVTSQDEMRGFEFVADGTNEDVRTALADRLTNDGRWGPEFETVFGSSEITYAKIAEAMGAYEDSQVFIDTPWRAYVQGRLDAIDDSAKRGALLFFRTTEQGGADCASCHSGDFFTDEDFHSVCVPQIGRGKGDGDIAPKTNDFGRAREVDDRNYRFSFRTPTLLNVAATGPYFHSGAYASLRDAVAHHLDPRAAIDAYDPASVPQAASEDFDSNTQEMIAFLDVSGRGIATLETPLELSDAEIDDLVAFLEALTDPCVLDRACLSPWIADPGTDDVDENLLVAIDRDRNRL